MGGTGAVGSNSHLDIPFLDSGVALHPPPTLEAQPSSFTMGFAEKIHDNLQQLQACVASFLKRLDQQVERLGGFYFRQVHQFLNDYAAMRGCSLQLALAQPNQNVRDDEAYASLLKKVVQLERFIFLNYTGITKIMKKLDRHSGLRLSEIYLQQLNIMPFYKSEPLSSLKKRLMEDVSGVHSQNEAIASTAISSTLQSTADYSFPPASLLPNQKILISMSGPHGTDIIGAVLQCLAKYGCPVEDFSLSRLQHNVTFGCRTTLKSSDLGIFNYLAEKAREWDATLHFDSHGEQAVNSLEDAPYANRIKYAATVLNQHGLSSAFLFDWTRLLLDYKISVEKMHRLSSLDAMLACVDFRLSVPVDVNIDLFRESLFQLSRKYGTDVALQPDDVYRKNKRLVIFDMDSTLIQQEVIDEIAKHAGVVSEVAKITEAAMNGEIDFKESLRRRVALLKGTSSVVFELIKSTLTFTEGAHYLCKALKKLGYKLAVISGGFMPLALYVKAELGLDYAFANNARSDGTTFTGETVGPIVDGLRKAELLEVIAQAESVTTDQVIAVGDGANDLQVDFIIEYNIRWMLAAAGLGIAFNAKPRVQEKARARINQKSLRNVLYLLGYTDRDAKQLADLQ